MSQLRTLQAPRKTKDAACCVYDLCGQINTYCKALLLELGTVVRLATRILVIVLLLSESLGYCHYRCY